MAVTVTNNSVRAINAALLAVSNNASTASNGTLSAEITRATKAENAIKSEIALPKTDTDWASILTDD